MTYNEVAKYLRELEEKRRAISKEIVGILPIEGKEQEHAFLCKQIEETRKYLRRIRYGTDE